MIPISSSLMSPKTNKSDVSSFKTKLKQILKSNSPISDTYEFNLSDVENNYKSYFHNEAENNNENIPAKKSLNGKDTLVQSDITISTKKQKGQQISSKLTQNFKIKKRKVKQHNIEDSSSKKNIKIVTKNMNNQGTEMMMVISNIIQNEKKSNSKAEIISKSSFKNDTSHQIINVPENMSNPSEFNMKKSLDLKNICAVTAKKNKGDSKSVKKSTNNNSENMNVTNHRNDDASVLNSDEFYFNPGSIMAKDILKKIKDKKKIKHGIEKLFINNSNKSFHRENNDDFLSKINDVCIYKRSPVEILKNSSTYSALSTISNIIVDPEPISNFEMEESIVSESMLADVGQNIEIVDPYQETPLDTEMEDVTHHSFLIESGYCIAIFKAPSRVYFCGKLKASVLYGSVTVHGYKLNEIPQDIYSVYSSSLLSFETSETIDDIILLSSRLTKLGLCPSNIKLILEKSQTSHSVLLLKPLNNTLVDFINQHTTDCNLFTKNKEINIDIEKEAFKLLQCTFYDGKITKPLDDNMSLNDLSELLISPDKNYLTNKITMLCGGKNAGKSTLLRHLVNKSLKDGPVLILDFDPGQPEFTICGLLSVTLVQQPLLGPNFTHLLKPDRSLNLGLIHVLQNEKRYINCVKDLVQFCKSCEDYIGIPWIVNTIGFVGALGLKLLVSIIDICKPNILIEIMSSNMNNNYEIRLSPENVHNIKIEEQQLSKSSIIHEYDYHLLQPYQTFLSKEDEFTLSKHIEAKTERLLNVLAYCSQMVSVKCCSILNATPYTVPFGGIELYFNNVTVEEDFIPSVLNGRLVALCGDKEKDVNSEGLKIVKYESEPIVCHGYGIIRGIDVGKGLIYILTPLKMESLHLVNILAYADALPECCSILSAPHLPSKTAVPYAAPIKAQGGSKHKHLHQIPKRKFNPLRLLEMARKSKK